MSDWETAGARHEIEYGGEVAPGHWHEPDYPSCVVCKMRKLEEENKTLQRNLEYAHAYADKEWQEGQLKFSSATLAYERDEYKKLYQEKNDAFTKFSLAYAHLFLERKEAVELIDELMSWLENYYTEAPAEFENTLDRSRSFLEGLET